jgi:hypothetical protein
VNAEIKDVLAFVASDHFARMPLEKQEQYLDKVRSVPERRTALFRMEELPEDQRGKARDNMGAVGRAAMAKEAVAFFKMTPEQQDAYLQKKKEEEEQRQKEREQRRAEAAQSGDTKSGDTAQKGPPRQRGSRNPDVMEKRMQARLSETTPEERACMQQYWLVLRAAGIRGGGGGFRGR